MDSTTQQPPPMPEQPPPQQQPIPVVSYATQAPSNQPAVLSLVFGLLFFIPFAAPGIVAIFFGRRGLRAAERESAGGRGTARAGIILGVVNLVLSVAFAGWLPFGLVQARRQQQTVLCAMNLRQIGMAAMMYANNNRGFLPPSIDHARAMVPGVPGAAIFICPACGTNPAKPPVLVGTTVSSHYHYIPPAARLTQVKTPSRAVLAYEPPTHHDGRGMNVLFCDGHVEVITGPTMPKVAAELAAGQNPPPSKK